MPQVAPPENDPIFNQIPNPDFDDTAPVSDSNPEYIIPDPIEIPSYCSIGDVADYLRIDINENTNPNKRMVEKIVLRNEDEIDRRTGHSWRTTQYANEVFDVNLLHDFGRGTGLYLKHRMIKPFDITKGDKIELWDGLKYVEHSFPNDNTVTSEPTHGVLYFRGFIFTLLRKHRFRVTYRYGGDQEGTSPVPRDIEKACLLMSCIDILSTDFQYSKISYGGEGNIDKDAVMRKWEMQVNRILSNRMEYHVIF